MLVERPTIVAGDVRHGLVLDYGRGLAVDAIDLVRGSLRAVVTGVWIKSDPNKES
jgi:hypothetical protein